MTGPPSRTRGQRRSPDRIRASRRSARRRSPGCRPARAPDRRGRRLASLAPILTRCRAGTRARRTGRWPHLARMAAMTSPAATRCSPTATTSRTATRPSAGTQARSARRARTTGTPASSATPISSGTPASSGTLASSGTRVSSGTLGRTVTRGAGKPQAPSARRRCRRSARRTPIRYPPRPPTRHRSSTTRWSCPTRPSCPVRRPASGRPVAAVRGRPLPAPQVRTATRVAARQVPVQRPAGLGGWRPRGDPRDRARVLVVQFRPLPEGAAVTGLTYSAASNVLQNQGLHARHGQPKHNPMTKGRVFRVKPARGHEGAERLDRHAAHLPGAGHQDRAERERPDRRQRPRRTCASTACGSARTSPRSPVRSRRGR